MNDSRYNEDCIELVTKISRVSRSIFKIEFDEIL